MWCIEKVVLCSVYKQTFPIWNACWSSVLWNSYIVNVIFTWNSVNMNSMWAIYVNFTWRLYSFDFTWILSQSLFAQFRWKIMWNNFACVAQKELFVYLKRCNIFLCWIDVILREPDQLLHFVKWKRKVLNHINLTLQNVPYIL